MHFHGTQKPNIKKWLLTFKFSVLPTLHWVKNNFTFYLSRAYQRGASAPQLRLWQGEGARMVGNGNDLVLPKKNRWILYSLPLPLHTLSLSPPLNPPTRHHKPAGGESKGVGPLTRVADPVCYSGSGFNLSGKIGSRSGSRHLYLENFPSILWWF